MTELLPLGYYFRAYINIYLFLCSRMLSTVLQKRQGLLSSDEFRGLQTFYTRRLKRRNVDTREGLMIKAERCWAQAAALQSQQQDADVRRTVVKRCGSKLAKAQKYASLALADTSSQSFSDDDIKLYTLLLQADYAVLKQRWELVTEKLSAVRVGLLNPENSNPVFTEFVASKVDPLLKLALVQVGAPRGIDLDTFSKEKCGLKVDKDQNLTEITFLSYTAPVRFGELRTALSQAQKLTQALNDNTLAQDFENCLASWSHCVDLCGELKEDVDASMEDESLDIISSYAQFQLLVNRIRRDSVEISKLSDNKIVFRMLKMVMQNCQSLSELPGVHSQDDLVQAISTLTAYFESKMLIAYVDGFYPRDYIKQLAYTRSAYSKLSNFSNNDDIDAYNLPVNSSDIDKFKGEVKKLLAAKYGVAKLYEYTLKLNKVYTTQASNVDVYNLVNPIADLDVKKLDFVPLKPMFFDLAYSFTQE